MEKKQMFNYFYGHDDKLLSEFLVNQGILDFKSNEIDLTGKVQLEKDCEKPQLTSHPTTICDLVHTCSSNSDEQKHEFKNTIFSEFITKLLFNVLEENLEKPCEVQEQNSARNISFNSVNPRNQLLPPENQELNTFKKIFKTHLN